MAKANISGATAPVKIAGWSGFKLPQPQGSVAPLGGSQEVPEIEGSLPAIPEAPFSVPEAAPAAPVDQGIPEGVPQEGIPEAEGVPQEGIPEEGIPEEGPAQEPTLTEIGDAATRAGREAADAENWTGAEDADALHEYEKARQKEQTSYTNWGYDNRAEAEGNFPAPKGTTTADTLKFTAGRIQWALDDSGVIRRSGDKHDAMNGMEAVMNATKTSDKRTATAYATTAMVVLANRLRGEHDPQVDNAITGADVDEDVENYEFNPFAEFEAKKEEASANRINDGVPVEQFIKASGATLQQVSNKREYDAEGNVIPQETQRDVAGDYQAGAALLRAGLNSNIFMLRNKTKYNPKTGKPELVLDENNNPVQVVVLNPVAGNDFKKASKSVYDEFKNQTKFKAQVTPVTPEGDYVGAKQGERRKNKGELDERVGDMQEMATKLGRVPVSIVPEADFYRKMFLNQLVDAVVVKDESGQPIFTKNGTPRIDINAVEAFKGQPADKIFGFSKLGVDERDFTDANGEFAPGQQERYKATVLQAYEQKLKDLLSRDMAYAEVLTRGVPVYNRHMLDTTVNRVYNESTDANLQAHKDARGIFGPPPKTMMISNSEYHKTGLTEADIRSFWDGLRNGLDRELTPREKELSFLLSVAHALSGFEKINSDAKHATVLMEDMFGGPEGAGRMKRFADLGRKLKNAALAGDPNLTPRERVLSRKTLGGDFALDPDAQEAFKEVSEYMADDNWGFVLRSLTSLADYMDAKNSGKNTFVPRNTSAIDQNSAGRTFAALDIGGQQTLMRTGILWAIADQDSVYDKRSTQPFGNPRDYFVQKAIEGGIENVFGMRGGSNAGVVSDLQKLFQSFNDDKEKYPGFAKALAKTPLMTSDYGKPSAFHQDSARAFLKKYPDFEKRFKQIIQDNNLGQYDEVHWLNKIYGSTLNSILDFASTQAPKQAQRFANMFGELLSIKGAWGEDVSFGGLMEQDTGQAIQIADENNNPLDIPIKKTVKAIGARAQSKTIRNEDLFKTDEYSINDDNFIPRPGSYSVNAFGPWLGQYRESIVTGGLVNLLNPDVNAKPHQMKWVQTVHDNAILDAESFALGLYHGNNGTAMQKAIEYSPAVETYKSVKALSDRISQRIDSAIVDGKVDIGLNSDRFSLVLSELDYDYDQLVRKEKEGKLEPRDKAYKDYLDNPKSGYKPTGLQGRNRYNAQDKAERGTHEVSPGQLKNLLGKFLGYHNTQELLHKWAILGSKKKKDQEVLIKEEMRRGDVAFFN